MPGKLLSRGEHFQNEALRLWEAENFQPRIVNVQALAILALAYVAHAFRLQSEWLTPLVPQFRTSRQGSRQLVKDILRCGA